MTWWITDTSIGQRLKFVRRFRRLTQKELGRYKRATKESFEKWYHNQTRYQLAEDRQERS